MAAAALGGALLAIAGWAGVESSLRPPEGWVKVYVRSGCGPSEQAIVDARDAPAEVEFAVMPLDAAAAVQACAITLDRLERRRPWLAWVPEGWACRVLRRQARADYSLLGLEKDPAPVYQWGDRVGLGWSERRRVGLTHGKVEHLLD
jgi:hypothetical protein